MLVLFSFYVLRQGLAMYVAEAGLKLVGNLLPQPPECRYYYTQHLLAVNCQEGAGRKSREVDYGPVKERLPPLGRPFGGRKSSERSVSLQDFILSFWSL